LEKEEGEEVEVGGGGRECPQMSVVVLTHLVSVFVSPSCPLSSLTFEADTLPLLTKPPSLLSFYSPLSPLPPLSPLSLFVSLSLLFTSLAETGMGTLHMPEREREGERESTKALSLPLEHIIYIQVILYSLVDHLSCCLLSAPLAWEHFLDDLSGIPWGPALSLLLSQGLQSSLALPLRPVNSTYSWNNE